MTPTAELRKIEWAQSGRADPLFLLCTEPGDSCGKSNPFPPTRRRPTVDHSLVAGGAQRQWLQACLPDDNQPQCLSSPCLSRPVPRGPSLNLRRLPVWPALRFPIIDDAKLAPIVVKMIEVFGRYPFEHRRLTIDSRWLRSALSWPPLGVRRIVPGRCGVAPAALRPSRFRQPPV